MMPEALRTFSRKDPSKLFILPYNNKDFMHDLALLLEEICYQNKKGVIVSYDLRQVQITKSLADIGINVGDDVLFIDAVDKLSGLDARRVKNLVTIEEPADFQNIYFYIASYLKALNSDSAFVMVISPYNALNYTSADEIAVGMKWLVDRVNEMGVPIFFIYKLGEDMVLDAILSRLVSYRDSFVG
jgi:hypothetical protein